MTRIFATAALLLSTALPAFADDHGGSGDPAEGEDLFGRCRSCHMISADDGTTIQRGGRTGPNLYGVIGREAGSVEDYRYSDLMETAGEQGLVWTAEALADYLEDPAGYLKEFTDSNGRTKMTFRLRKGGGDVAAYLASVAPAPETTAEAE